MSSPSSSKSFLRILLVLASTAVFATVGYEYVGPRQGYRYVEESDPNSWVYPAGGVRNGYYHRLNNREVKSYQRTAPQYSESDYEYAAPARSSRNRISNYGVDSSRRTYPTFTEVERPSPIPYNRNRWAGNLKRQAPSRSLSLDRHNRVQMGVSSSYCDDAKTNLTLDWDLSPLNYTCFHPETRFPRSFDADPILQCESLPPRYVPGHVCMDQGIPYKDAIPTHGDHRPLWPKFGEYMFVPRERWLHNIEHGAVVMLYHPCAYPSEVNRLRTIVRGCVGKHVITPSTYLSPERPFALVAWGCRLLMSSVDDELAMNFIKTRAHRGPEGTYTKEGQYELGLIKPAKSTGNGAKYGYSRVTCDTLDRSRL